MGLFLDEITDFKSAFALSSDYLDAITFKICEVFQINYCVFLWLKGLKNFIRSMASASKMIR